MIKNQAIKSKFEQVYDSLLENMDKKFKVGDRLPTETELAELLSVNRMTVAKVMSVLKQEGYVKRGQGTGTFLIAKPQQTVADGIITFLPYSIDMLHDPFFTPLANAVACEALRLGLVNSWVGGMDDRKNDFTRLQSLCSDGKYQGVIITDPRVSVRESWREYFRGQAEPRSVWVGVSPKIEKSVNCVDTDQETGVFGGLEFLFAQGCRRIGFLSRAPDTYNRIERLRSYKDFHAYKKLVLDERQIVLIDHVQSMKEAGYAGFKRLAASELQMDAMLVADRGLLDGLQILCQEGHEAAKFNLPMVVFDYQFSGGFDRQVLAAITQPIEDLGRTAVNMLTQLFGEKAKPPLQTVLKSKLMLRD